MSDCEKIAERLQAYLDGEGTPDETAEVESHMAGCAECRALPAQWRRLSEGAREVPEVDEGRWEALWSRVEARTQSEEAKTGVWRSAGRGAAITALAASVLLAAYFFFGEPTAVEPVGAVGNTFRVVSIEVPSPDYSVYVTASGDDALPVIWLERM